MIIPRYSIVFLAGVLICLMFTGNAMARNRYSTDVRIIRASTGPAYVDPALADLGRELKSVFKYTEYRLIQQKRMDLQQNQDGRVSLPGGRALIVRPTGVQGSRLTYNIQIRKKQKSLFQTQVLLKNNHSITIGGPRVKKGVLLINISGSLR